MLCKEVCLPASVRLTAAHKHELFRPSGGCAVGRVLVARILVIAQDRLGH